MKLLLVLPFNANDAVLAEALLNHVFLLNRRVKQQDILLVCGGNVHAELLERVKTSAEVAFTNVEVINASTIATGSKDIQVNRMFASAAEHVEKCYRHPFFWLEPDCVPVEHKWLEKLGESYDGQGKRYHGARMLLQKGQVVLCRPAIYPNDAFSDLKGACALEGPFNIVAAPALLPMTSKCPLVIDLVRYADTNVKIPEQAVVFHADKGGVWINHNRERLEKATQRK